MAPSKPSKAPALKTISKAATSSNDRRGNGDFIGSSRHGAKDSTKNAAINDPKDAKLTGMLKESRGRVEASIKAAKEDICANHMQIAKNSQQDLKMIEDHFKASSEEAMRSLGQNIHRASELKKRFESYETEFEQLDVSHEIQPILLKDFDSIMKSTCEGFQRSLEKLAKDQSQSK